MIARYRPNWPQAGRLPAKAYGHREPAAIQGIMESEGENHVGAINGADPRSHRYVLVSLYRGTACSPCSVSGLDRLAFPSFTRAHSNRRFQIPLIGDRALLALRSIISNGSISLSPPADCPVQGPRFDPPNSIPTIARQYMAAKGRGVLWQVFERGVFGYPY
jgi:hypothetical protein